MDSGQLRFTDNSESFSDVEDPLADKDINEQNSCTNSESEDFLGFESTDIKNEIVNASTGEVYVVFHEDEADVDQTTQSESKEIDDEIDDEIIIVENKVEVIEIDDDDDEVISF